MIKKNLKSASRYTLSKEEAVKIVKAIVDAVKDTWVGNAKQQHAVFKAITDSSDLASFKKAIKKLHYGTAILTDMYDHEDKVFKLFKSIAEFGRAKAHRPKKEEGTGASAKKPDDSGSSSSGISGDGLLHAVTMIPFVSNMLGAMDA